MTNSNRPGAKNAAAPGTPLRHKSKSVPNLADIPEHAKAPLHKCSSEGLLGARVVTPRATTTGGATADVEVALSAADVQACLDSLARIQQAKKRVSPAWNKKANC